MLGLNSCINAELTDLFFEILIADFIELSARDSLRGVADDAELHCDCNGGILMVARYHNGRYACVAAFLNSRLNLGTNRVNHTRKTDENKVVFKRVG